MRAAALLIALAPAAVLGCTDASDEPELDAPTWHQDVAPLIGRHCSSCHADGGIGAPLLFDTYDDAVNFGPLIRNAVATGDMPPFMGRETEVCTPEHAWTNDARLLQSEIDTLVSWVDAGMPEGDPATAAPIPEPAAPDLTGPTEVLVPASPYTVPPVGDQADVFACISLDPGLTEDGWLEAYKVLPDDPRVVHHVLVGIDATGASAELAGPDGFYDCLGGFEVPASFIGGWVPGGAPVLMPEGSAVQVPADGRIVLQMHYHLIDEAVPDATGLEIQWTDGAPDQVARFGLFGNRRGTQPDPEDGGQARLFIPAGKPDHREHLIIPWTVAGPSRVFMVWNHMHYIGTSMRAWVERPGREPSCLLHTPDWDFDWQQSFFYDAAAGQAPLLLPGDELHLECIYDNTLDNPGVRKILAEAGLEEPVDVSVGEGSLDEMCLVTLGVVPAAFPVTHLGEATLTVRTEDGRTEDTCTATVEVAIDPIEGIIDGRASCELDALGQPRTLTASFGQYTWDGTGEVSGEGTFGLSGFASGPATWSGTVTDGRLQAEMVGTYAGIGLTVTASVDAVR